MKNLYSEKNRGTFSLFFVGLKKKSKENSRKNDVSYETRATKIRTNLFPGIVRTRTKNETTIMLWKQFARNEKYTINQRFSTGGTPGGPRECIRGFMGGKSATAEKVKISSLNLFREFLSVLQENI